MARNGSRKELRLLRREQQERQVPPRRQYFLAEREHDGGVEVFAGTRELDRQGQYHVKADDAARFSWDRSWEQGEPQLEGSLRASVKEGQTLDDHVTLWWDVAAMKRAKTYAFEHGALKGFLGSRRKTKNDPRRSSKEAARRELFLLYDRSKDAYVLGESTLNALPEKGGASSVRLSEAMTIATYARDPEDAIFWKGQALRNDFHQNKYFYDSPRGGSLKLKRKSLDVIAKGPQEVMGFLAEKTGLYSLGAAVARAYGLPGPQKPVGKSWEKTAPAQPEPQEKRSSSWNYEYGGISMGDIKL